MASSLPVSVLEYIAPWPLYALAWSSSPSSPALGKSSTLSVNSNTTYEPSPPPTASSDIPVDARLAIGSFVDEYTNRIQVLGVGQDETGTPCLKVVADASHPYPATRIAFQPSSLSGASSSASSSSATTTTNSRYSNPSSKMAKRASWGASHASTSGYGSGRGSSSSDNDESMSTPRYPTRELLATTADCLRVWECAYDEEEGPRSSFVGASNPSSGLQYSLREKSVLAHSKNTTSPPAPLTSFSWNTPSPNLIVTSSIDTTCTIWDLPSRTALTQLIAHDREVYDVDWCPGSADVFASVGADGSVRVFDLRSLEHSTIIYETGNPGATASASGGNGGAAAGSGGGGEGGSRPNSGSSSTKNVSAAPLLRIAFNPWDANYLATFHLDSDTVQILDVRAPGSPILELRGHAASVNAVAWGPPGSGGMGGATSSKGMVCTAADDCQCLVYDLASATLRSASAQGRRSRNGAGPSPAPSSSNSSYLDGRSATPARFAEAPILTYAAHEMVNNVAWLRASTSTILQSPSTNSKGSVVQEWDDYTARARQKQQSGNNEPDVDWLAMVAGQSVKALRV